MKIKLIQFFILIWGIFFSAIANSISLGTLSDAISSKPKQLIGDAHPSTQKLMNPKKSPNTFPNPALFIEDAAMTGFIDAQLLLNRDIPSVNIRTDDAVVTISGKVQTAQQADRLIKIASTVKGVKAVKTENLIIVK